MKSEERSRTAYQRAQNVIPGGVNSPVRAYRSVGGIPPFIQRGRGAFIYDIEGREYIDYVLSYGPLILGHAHPRVVEAIQKAAQRGTSFGAPTEAETELAELVRERLPHVERLRLVSSGTEAVMTAVRLARGFTGREMIVKFDGCYHGHSDALLVQAGSGLATGGLPGSKGVPAAVTRLTLSLPYNDLAAIQEVFHHRGKEIAGVIVEPVAANMGVVLPREGFLQELRQLTQRNSIVLIFDEVITGFRLARGGATEVYGVTPDLVCLGKVLGGGMPIGAVGGKRDIMEQLAPLGEVYQAGTLSGNPISVAAGLATLKELNDPAVYEQLTIQTQQLAKGLQTEFSQKNVPMQVNQACGLLTVFFTNQPVTDFVSAQKSEGELFRRFFHAMLQAGIYLPPSPYEAWFLSLQHSDEVITTTLAAVRDFLKA